MNREATPLRTNVDRCCSDRPCFSTDLGALNGSIPAGPRINTRRIAPRASLVQTTDQPVRIGNHGRPVGRFNALIHERRLRDPLYGDSRAGALGVSVGPKPESTQHTRALPPATRRLDTGEDASYPSDYRDVTSYVLFGIEQRTATPPGRSPERAHLGSRRGSYCSCYTPAFTPARGPTGRPAG